MRYVLSDALRMVACSANTAPESVSTDGASEAYTDEMVAIVDDIADRLGLDPWRVGQQPSTWAPGRPPDPLRRTTPSSGLRTPSPTRPPGCNIRRTRHHQTRREETPPERGLFAYRFGGEGMGRSVTVQLTGGWKPW